MNWEKIVEMWESPDAEMRDLATSIIDNWAKKSTRRSMMKARTALSTLILKSIDMWDSPKVRSLAQISSYLKVKILQTY